MTNTITKTTYVKAPIERVWRAISDHNEFGQWFKVALDQPFAVGQDSTGKMTYPGYEGYPWFGRVLAIEPNHRLAYEWVPGPAEIGQDLSNELRTNVEFLLEPEGDGTRVTIIESGFDKLPEERRESVLRGNTKGWDAQADNLREYAEARAEA